MSRIIIDENLVCEMYTNMKKSTKEIANRFNRSTTTIRRILKKYNIQTQGSKTKVIDGYFDKWSNHMAYIVGYLVADGCVSKRGNCYSLCTSCKFSDFSIIDYIISQICPTHQGKFTQSGIYPQYYAHFVCTHCYDNLCKLGIVENKTGKEFLVKMDYQFFRHYLRGLFDGDGCISITSRKNTKGYITICSQFSIVSANRRFLEDIKRKIDYFYNNDDIGTVRKHHKIYIWNVSNIKDIRKINDFMYQNVEIDGGFYLKRKRDIFDIILSPNRRIYGVDLYYQKYPIYQIGKND